MSSLLWLLHQFLQLMSGNDSSSADQYMFGAWLKSTYIKKSDLEEYMSEFSQELTEKIKKEIPQTEATQVYVSESGIQGKVTEMVRTIKTIYPLYAPYFIRV